MAKLKLISRHIPWSLAAKSLGLACAWAFLSFPLFLAVAAFLYCVPLFDARRFRFLFLVMLGIAWFVPANFLSFVLLAALFFILCGIRYLLFVDRVYAYELLVFVFCIALSFIFFSHMDRIEGDVMLGAAILAFVLFKLFQGFFAYAHASGVVQSGHERAALIFPALLSFILFELALALLFLPIHIFSQTAFLFLAAVSGIDMALDYVRGVRDERRVRIALSIFLSAAVLILLSNQWGL